MSYEEQMDDTIERNRFNKHDRAGVELKHAEATDLSNA